MVKNDNWERDAELAELEEDMRKRLAPIPVSTPSSDDTARLIQALQSDFDELKHAVTPFDRESANYASRPTLWKLCAMQMATYQRSFWFVSLIFFAMLTLMIRTKTVFFEPFHSQNMYSALLPIFMVSAMIYSYRTWNKEMRTIESITPYPPMLLMLSRYLITVVICIGYGLCGSLYLSLVDYQFPLYDFVLQWLSLMVFVAGFLAYVMLWKGIRVAMVASLAVWWVHGKAMDYLHSQVEFDIDRMTNAQLTVLAAGIVICVLAYRRGSRMSYVRQ